ncbi:MAG: hypothetical protein RR929_01065 [Erysipelotrichaceae bacterium]
MNTEIIKGEVIKTVEATSECAALEIIKHELIIKAKKDIDTLNDVFIEKALALAPFMDTNDVMTMLKIITDREGALLRTLKSDAPSQQTNIQNNYRNKDEQNAKLKSQLLDENQLEDIYKEFGVDTSILKSDTESE